jgi:hypothetical protein
MSTFRRCLAALAAILAIPATGHAQQADAWKWQAVIYGYFPDIGGTTTFPQAAGGSDVTVDAAKIIDALKFTFMGTLEAHNGRWGVMTDVTYMDVGGFKSGTRDFALGGLPLPGGAAANADFDLKGTVWTLAGVWRLSSDPNSPADLVAGTRLLDITQRLKWEITGNVGTVPLPGRAGEASAKLSNWDAIVGIKGRVPFAGGQWFVPYYADVGTGESKLTWQAIAGLGYSFKWGDFVAAWRHVDYDMKSGKSVENLTFNGPAIAAVFRW